MDFQAVQQLIQSMPSTEVPLDQSIDTIDDKIKPEEHPYCTVCFDTTSTLIRLDCDDQYCKKCLSHHIGSQLNVADFPPKCCGQEILFKQYASTLDDHLLTQFAMIRVQNLQQGDICCAEPTCNGRKIAWYMKVNGWAVCRKCLGMTCCQCHQLKSCHRDDTGCRVCPPLTRSKTPPSADLPSLRHSENAQAKPKSSTSQVKPIWSNTPGAVVLLDHGRENIATLRSQHSPQRQAEIQANTLNPHPFVVLSSSGYCAQCGLDEAMVQKCQACKQILCTRCAISSKCWHKGAQRIRAEQRDPSESEKAFVRRIPIRHEITEALSNEPNGLTRQQICQAVHCREVLMYKVLAQMIEAETISSVYVQRRLRYFVRRHRPTTPRRMPVSSGFSGGLSHSNGAPEITGFLLQHQPEDPTDTSVVQPQFQDPIATSFAAPSFPIDSFNDSPHPNDAPSFATPQWMPPMQMPVQTAPNHPPINCYPNIYSSSMPYNQWSG